MTVKELKQELAKLSSEFDKAIVICQKDSEGNGYSPLSCIDEKAVYQADSTWSGDVYSTEWSAEDVDMSEEDWEEFKNKNVRCLVLAPIN